MKNWISFLVVMVFFALTANVASAQDLLLKWHVCQLGKAPIAKGPTPSDAKVFPAAGGPVLMSEAGPPKDVKTIRIIECDLQKGTPSYRGQDGTLRDVASNQPYWPVGWDAAPPPAPKNGIDGTKGDKGDRGDIGPQGPAGNDGVNGKDAITPPPIVDKGGNFFASKKFWVPLIAGGTIVGTACAVKGCMTQTTRVITRH